MKNSLTIVSTAILAAGLLAACGDNDENVNTGENATPDNENNTNENDIEENNDNENNLNDDNNNADDNGESAAGSGDYDDQEDLRLGDTGTISSDSGEFELTLHSMVQEDEIEGEPSQIGHYFVAEITIQNIGETTLNAEEVVSNLNITHDLEGSGGGNFSTQFEEIDIIEGDLEPGEEVKGEGLFDIFEAEEYYIRITEGLISSGVVHNQVIWTFNDSETE